MLSHIATWVFDLETLSISCSANGRFWHLADNPTAPAFVRFWTKADIRESSCT